MYTKSYSETFPKVKEVSNGVNPPSVTAANITLTGSRTGQSVPDWREKVRKGLNASSPYTLDRTKIVKDSQSEVHIDFNRTAPTVGPVTHQYVKNLNMIARTAPNHLLTSYTAVDNEALAKVYQKMNGQISHLNAPAVFAEALDVVRQFGRPFQSIVQLTERHLNRLYLQKRGITALRYNKKQVSRILADTYLEYAFGLAPLIKDTERAAEALARWEWEASGESRQSTKLVGRAMIEASSVIAPMNLRATPSYIVTRTNTTVKTKVRAQYAVGFSSFPTADFGSLDRLKQLLGFRPESWIPAVWEAVPWSWLFDYFSNIQQILNSLEGSVVKPTWICKTLSSVTDVESVERIDPVSTLGMVKSYIGTSKTTISGDQLRHLLVRRTSVVRTVPTILGLPSLQFGLPDSWRQIANMSAVLLTMRRSTPAISLESHYRNLLRN